MTANSTDKHKADKHCFHSLYFISAIVMLLWTIIIAVSVHDSIEDEYRYTERLIHDTAIANFNKDQSFRLWASSQGGIYVPVSEKTPPNPYLEHVEERDIETVGGKRLTLMNPAYIMRQVMEDHSALFGTHGHITSLNPLRPENAPDAWERSALEAMEEGAKEAFKKMDMGGKQYYRLMRPMIVKEHCLKCHADQGYQIGDIRGGVSVSIPIASYLTMQEGEIRSKTSKHVLALLIGLIAIVAISQMKKRQLSERLNSQQRLREWNLRLEEHVKQRTESLRNANTRLEQEIEERRFAEESLKESEEKFGLISAQSLMAIAILQDNKIQFVNQAYADILEYSKEEILAWEPGAIYEKTIHPDYLEFVKEQARKKQMGEDGYTVRYSYKILAKSGKIKWVDQYSETISYQGKTADLVLAIDITEAKQAEQTIIDSEHRYHTYVSNAPEGIFIANEKGCLIDVNETACRMTGYDRESLLQFSVSDITRRIDPDVISQKMRNLAKYGKIDLETTFSRKDGKDFPVNLKAVVLSNDRYMAFCSDIGERKRIEESLRESEEKFRIIGSSALDAVIMIDGEGDIVYWNPSAQRIFGYAEEEVKGKSVHDLLMPSKYKERFQRGFTAYLECGEGEAIGKVVELTAKNKNGREFPIEIAISSIRIKGKYWATAIIRDISKRKLAEENLLKEQGFTEKVVQSIPGLFYIIDSETGRLMRRNDNWVKVTGYSDAEIDSMAIFDFFEHGPNRDKTVAEIRKVFEIGHNSMENHLLTKSKEKKAFRFTGEKVVIDGKSYVIGLGSDIGELKKAEVEKAKLESQLLQSQKMEAVGRLAGGVAHDFNNLLTGITGHISLAQMDLDSKDPLFEILAEINNAADRASDLTGQLLAFSRKQLIEPKIVDINGLIENMSKMLVRIIGEDIDLHTISQPDLGKVKADPGRLEQVIVNLAVNARDAMNKGGKLTIETADRVLDLEHCLKHPHVKPGCYVMLAVSDSGEGMDDQTCKKIFDPFFTTKKEGKGTGLGLSTVYGIIKQHNGFIDVYSEPGQGTSFKIYLPQVSGEADSITRPQTLGELPVGSETILIVEDEPMVRHIAKRILKRQGYNVLTADSGGNALLLVEKNPSPIDLLLTDVIMPNMNGKELADKLKEISPELKILFTSGYTENVIAPHGVLEEELEFIGKPYTPHTLARKVRQVLDS